MGFDLGASPRAVDAVIAAGASQSAELDLQGGRLQLVGLQMPAAWTAASLTFLVSADGTTFSPLYYAGAEYTVAAAGGAVASAAISLVPEAFAGWTHVKVRSGVAATPVNQAAERTIRAMTRSVR